MKSDKYDGIEKEKYLPVPEETPHRKKHNKTCKKADHKHNYVETTDTTAFSCFIKLCKRCTICGYQSKHYKIKRK